MSKVLPVPLEEPEQKQEQKPAATPPPQPIQQPMQQPAPPPQQPVQQPVRQPVTRQLPVLDTEAKPQQPPPQREPPRPWPSVQEVQLGYERFVGPGYVQYGDAVVPVRYEILKVDDHQRWYQTPTGEWRELPGTAVGVYIYDQNEKMWKLIGQVTRECERATSYGSPYYLRLAPPSPGAPESLPATRGEAASAQLLIVQHRLEGMARQRAEQELAQLAARLGVEGDVGLAATRFEIASRLLQRAGVGVNVEIYSQLSEAKWLPPHQFMEWLRGAKVKVGEEELPLLAFAEKPLATTAYSTAPQPEDLGAKVEAYQRVLQERLGQADAATLFATTAANQFVRSLTFGLARISTKGEMWEAEMQRFFQLTRRVAVEKYAGKVSPEVLARAAPLALVKPEDVEASEVLSQEEKAYWLAMHKHLGGTEGALGMGTAAGLGGIAGYSGAVAFANIAVPKLLHSLPGGSVTLPSGEKAKVPSLAERLSLELRLHLPEKVQAGLQRVGLMARGEYTVVATESGPVLKFEPAKIPHVPSQVKYAVMHGKALDEEVAVAAVKYEKWTPVPEGMRDALSRAQLKPGEVGYLPLEGGKKVPVVGWGEHLRVDVVEQGGLRQAGVIVAKGTEKGSIIVAAEKGFTFFPGIEEKVAVGTAKVAWKELLAVEKVGGMTPSYMLVTPIPTYHTPSPRLPVVQMPAPTPQVPLVTLPAPATVTPTLLRVEPKLPVLEREREEQPAITPQLRVPVVEQPLRAEHPPAPLLPAPVHKIVNTTTPTSGARLAPPITQPATGQTHTAKAIPRLETPQLAQPAMKPAMAPRATPRLTDAVAKQAPPTPPVFRMPSPPAHPPMQIIPRFTRKEWTVTWLGAPKLPTFKMPAFKLPNFTLGKTRKRR